MKAHFTAHSSFDENGTLSIEKVDKMKNILYNSIVFLGQKCTEH